VKYGGTGLAVGTLAAGGVEYNSKRQRENRHVEVKEIHKSYRFFTNTMLNIQKITAKSRPEMIVVTASGANWGTTNGTTAEAMQTCPRSAAIAEIFFICAGDSMLL